MSEDPKSVGRRTVKFYQEINETLIQEWEDGKERIVARMLGDHVIEWTCTFVAALLNGEIAGRKVFLSMTDHYCVNRSTTIYYSG